MTDPTVQWMIAHKIPLTRESYLYVEYFGNPPTEDAEVEIPAEILRTERRLVARKDAEFLREVGAKW